MEGTSSTGVGSPESTSDYSFGFDNVNFSDRTLLLEIIDDPATEPNPDDRVLDNAFGTASLPRVKTIHISSLILAAKSSFFRKLFSNGMRESEQRHITLQIGVQEEVSFMDLLNYIYSKKLPNAQFPLLDLLKTADKFEVASCLRDCSRSLQNLPMTFESASHYLDLPPTLLTSREIKPLIDAAKQCLAAHFKDIERFKEEVLNLPLVGIQAVLSSDGLRVASECVVYDLVLMWARKHYPNLEERRGILRTHLLHVVRFPLMTTSKLIKEVLTCSDIDSELSSKIVFSALHFKSETPHGQRCLAAEKDNAATHRFVKRAYTNRAIKVVDFALPFQQCTVYLDLKREELSQLIPDGHISTETFNLGGQESNLIAKVSVDTRTGVHHFELSLVMQVASRSNPNIYSIVGYRTNISSQEFMPYKRGSHTFTKGPGSIKCLLRMTWNDFAANSSPYFVNGIAHLWADLRINKTWY